jgi:acetyl esterase
MRQQESDMTDIFIRPDVRAFLDMMAANPRPAFTADFIAQIRNMPIDMAAMMDLPVGDLGDVRDVTMPGPGGDIALRLFDGRATRDPGPVVVFFHGGGFCLGSIDSHAGFCGEMARQLDLPVVSVDYRLAPEHPWPAGVDDGEAAARWIAENGAAFGRAFTGIVLCGDSAGGDLTLVRSTAEGTVFELTLPGGAQVAAAGVSDVGVVPTHRRRGILTALIGAPLFAAVLIRTRQRWS